MPYKRRTQNVRRLSQPDHAQHHVVGLIHQPPCDEPILVATLRNRNRLLRMHSDTLLKRITMSADICHGKPCIRGLRYPVEFILEMLSGDSTEAELLEDYPDLEPQDFKAAQAYAARLAKIKSFAPLTAA